MRYCRNKQINKLVVDIVRKGWRFSRGKRGKISSPFGTGFVTGPSTSSDYQFLQSLCRDIRRQVPAD